MRTFLLPLLLSPILALSQPLSTGALDLMAKGSDEARGMAYGYVSGVVEASDARLVCIPSATPFVQVIQTITRDLDRAPSELSAARGLLAQLPRHYPCK